MLQLENVRKTYITKAGEVNALNGISLTFPSTGLVFITGKSGCGKTTLLNVIGGLDGIDAGEIYIQDKGFSTFTAQEYDSYRNTFVGFIFQEYNLLSEFSVENNIRMAMELQGREMDETELEKLLKDVEIEELRKRKPSELSGGQRQRVAIARALVKQPRIIMADEPTGALDGATGVQVLETLKRLSKDKLIIVVSHDNEFAERYADRVIRLVDGQVVEDITFSEREMQANVSEKGNSLVVKEGADLSESEKDLLAKAVKERKKIEFTEKVSYREKKKTGKVEKDQSEPIAFKKSKMKLKSSAQIGIKSLAVKPIRLIITIIISALAFAVFGLFDTIANFSTHSILKNHLKENSSTVVVNADYIVDRNAKETYNLKLSEEAVAMLGDKTGGVVKGIFAFDTTLGKETYTQYVEEVRYSSVVIGSAYYTKETNGFIEFDADTEIKKDDTFKDFDYRLIKGRYPKIITNKGVQKEDETLHEIAISKHLAESIIFFLNGEKLQDKNVVVPENLLSSKITINGDEYTIVGIVDCGEIPKKYDELKSVAPNNIYLNALSDDYTAFLNSSAQKCIFVAQGFKTRMNKKKASADLCFAGGIENAIQMQTASGVEKFSVNEYFYSARDYDKDNILLFSGNYGQDGAVALKDDEVLIHPVNFERIYHKIISQIESAEERNALLVKFRAMATSTAEQNAETFAYICNYLNIVIDNHYLPATIQQTSTKSDRSLTKDVKIVGLYFGVEAQSYVSGAGFKMMIGDGLMQTLNVYPEQGDYSKVLLSRESIKKGSDVIANYLMAEQGLALSWYKNSVLSVISDNETVIKQASNLFLYVALALAVFSIFMLYNYISTSIANKQRSVGVLRGLGAGGKDILLIFLTESLVIGIINGILANVFSLLGCYLVNWYIMNEMNIFVAFALFGGRQILLISLVSLVTAVLASLLPIIKISKKKPVDLIRRA